MADVQPQLGLWVCHEHALDDVSGGLVLEDAGVAPQAGPVGEVTQLQAVACQAAIAAQVGGARNVPVPGAPAAVLQAQLQRGPGAHERGQGDAAVGADAVELCEEGLLGVEGLVHAAALRDERAGRQGRVQLQQARVLRERQRGSKLRQQAAGALREDR